MQQTALNLFENSPLLFPAMLEPLVRDRITIASAAKSEDNALDQLSGRAIWASVSDEVDDKIREQIKAGKPNRGQFVPARRFDGKVVQTVPALAADEWNSGKIHWLFDVITPNQKLTTSVIANFKQVVKEGDLRIHPLITRLVDPETLEKMGAAPVEKSDGGS